jgi:hypothetical protein
VILPDGSIKEREASKAMFGSHTITKGEIEELVKTRPDIIVVGTGTDGAAQLSRDAQAYAEKKRVNLVTLDSFQAVKRLNQLAEEGKPVAALIHITC